MKIIALQAENIKKLVAVEIKPNGNLVAITGANGQGKTSVLDAIWWALAGASHIQAAPIRKGENKARIRLDLGEIVVTRTFRTGKDGEAATSITVENAQGARFPSPQVMLDKLLGELSFDPLAFARATGKEQYERLRVFVPGVDFDAIDRDNREAYELRAIVNRKAKEAQAAADQIQIPVKIPGSRIDESALVDQLQTAADNNANIESRKARRERFAEDIKTKELGLEHLHHQADTLRKQLAEIDEQAQIMYAESNAMREQLKSAEPLPAPVDVSHIRQQIEDAKTANALFERGERRTEHELEAARLRQQAEKLTEGMEARNQDKASKIASATLPVSGLGFGDGFITLNGQPFDQASDAEQLRASIAIAMALNPKIRVIRVLDGSLLDEKSMQILAEMADAQDCQVWVERVDGSGKVGFILEDGHVRKAE